MNYFKRYYAQLLDCHIYGVTFEKDEYEPDMLWPVLHLRHPNGDEFKVTLSSDEEGNAPGFAFIEGVKP